MHFRDVHQAIAKLKEAKTAQPKTSESSSGEESDEADVRLVVQQLGACTSLRTSHIAPGPRWRQRRTAARESRSTAMTRHQRRGSRTTATRYGLPPSTRFRAHRVPAASAAPPRSSCARSATARPTAASASIPSMPPWTTTRSTPADECDAPCCLSSFSHVLPIRRAHCQRSPRYAGADVRGAHHG